MPIGTGTVLAGVAIITALAIASGGGDEGGGSRDPWTKPIAPPQTPEETQATKQTLCACFRGGAREVDELAACALKQVYGGDVSWDLLMVPVEGDDPSLAHVVSVFRSLAKQLIELPEAQQPAWCGDDIGPIVPGVIVDPPPPPPTNDPTDINPWVGTKAGMLIRVIEGNTPVQIVARAHGISQATKNAERALWSYNMTGFNLYFYSRPVAAGSYGAVRMPNGKWYDVAPAMYSWNQNLVVAAAQHEKPMRQITWAGKKIKTLHKGFPYVAPMDMIDGELHARGDDAWDPARNPPKSVLDALQLDLEQMREVWEQNNP